MYEELIHILRNCVMSKPCDGCPYYDKNGPTEQCATLNLAAADAIEELVRKEKFHAFLWNTIQPNEMEAYLSIYNAGNEKEES